MVSKDPGYIQIPASEADRREFEAEAAKLNLSLSAYILMKLRGAPAEMPQARYDRIVQEVFGKYGTVMRNLAK